MSDPPDAAQHLEQIAQESKERLEAIEKKAEDMARNLDAKKHEMEVTNSPLRSIAPGPGTP